jgi:IS6 family transposase
VNSSLKSVHCSIAPQTHYSDPKYLNNIIEADHGALKRVIRPTRGFQTMKTAAATIKGFEIMRMIRRGHCLTCKPGVGNEIRFINRIFEVAV